MRPPPYRLDRIGIVMEPLPGDPQEAEGVLNPATARARDGELYLLPRLVARGNFSRVGRARVLFDSGGKPSGVERLGVVLEPDEAWEQNMEDGRQFRAVKVFYDPSELATKLRALGWNVEVHRAGRRFYWGSARFARLT